MVANLRNVDGTLAEQVADGLGLETIPDPTDPAQQPNRTLAPSPALSIVANGPQSFEGRKIGLLLSDDADAPLVEQLRTAVEAEGAQLELVAPRVGGITMSDGTSLPAHQKLGGGPSVLYDAVAIVISDASATMLAANPDARDFVADAYAHCVLELVAADRAFDSREFAPRPAARTREIPTVRWRHETRP